MLVDELEVTVTIVVDVTDDEVGVFGLLVGVVVVLLGEVVELVLVL